MKHLKSILLFLFLLAGIQENFTSVLGNRTLAVSGAEGRNGGVVAGEVGG